MAEKEEKKPPIGAEQVRAAMQTLNRYREGKAGLERRILEGERWYRMRHWESMRRGSPAQVEPASGWLFNGLCGRI